MAINEFLPFGLAVGSNVMPQAQYAALAGRTAGFASGVAQSGQCNKAWRQSAFIASCVAQFTADSIGKDVLDNGDTLGFENLLTLAVQNQARSILNAGNFATIPQLNAEAQTRGTADFNEGNVRAAADGAEAQARAQAVSAEANTRAAAVSAETSARVNGDQFILNNFSNYPPYSIFASGVALSGYHKFPGIILQWGQGTLANGYAEYVALPIAFPNNMLCAIASEGNAVGWSTAGAPITTTPSPTIYGTSIYSNSAIRISAVSIGGTGATYAGTNYRYIAIGN